MPTPPVPITMDARGICQEVPEETENLFEMLKIKSKITSKGF